MTKYLALFALTFALSGQTVDSSPRAQAVFTVSTLPTASSWTNKTALVTDGSSAGDCTTGSGATRVLCVSNGSAWASVGGSGVGGATTLINSFIFPHGTFFDNTDSIKPTSGTLICSDFALTAPTSVSKIWTYINTTESGKFFGAALYDDSGARLTASTSTGTSTTSGGQINSSFGGGSLTLSPGSRGRFTVCTTSNSTVFALIGEPPGVTLFQDSTAPIRYTAANTASGTSTITWPATLGAKTALSGGQRAGWVAIVP